MSDSFGTPQTVAHQAPLSMGFSRQEYWSMLPFPPPGHLPDPGIKLTSSALVSRFFTTEAPGKYLHVYFRIVIEKNLHMSEPTLFKLWLFNGQLKHLGKKIEISILNYLSVLFFSISIEYRNKTHSKH